MMLPIVLLVLAVCGANANEPTTAAPTTAVPTSTPVTGKLPPTGPVTTAVVTSTAVTGKTHAPTTTGSVIVTSTAVTGKTHAPTTGIVTSTAVTGKTHAPSTGAVVSTYASVVTEPPRNTAPPITTTTTTTSPDVLDPFNTTTTTTAPDVLDPFNTTTTTTTPDVLDPFNTTTTTTSPDVLDPFTTTKAPTTTPDVLDTPVPFSDLAYALNLIYLPFAGHCDQFRLNYPLYYMCAEMWEDEEHLNCRCPCFREMWDAWKNGSISDVMDTPCINTCVTTLATDYFTLNMDTLSTVSQMVNTVNKTCTSMLGRAITLYSQGWTAAGYASNVGTSSSSGLAPAAIGLIVVCVVAVVAAVGVIVYKRASRSRSAQITDNEPAPRHMNRQVSRVSVRPLLEV